MAQNDPSQPMKRVEDWKSRLIDLSRRNNLLYFHKSKRGSLPISQPDMQTVFNALVLKKKRLEFWLPPEEAQNIETTEKLTENGKSNIKTTRIAKGGVKPAANEVPSLPEIQNPRPKPNQLLSKDLSRSELERTLKALQWRSLLDYRERGVRILHAAFGTLNWVDLETKEQVQSPLILVPLELTRDTIRQRYTVGLPPVEDEEVLNPALQVKLKNDCKIDLPALPEEWENQNLQDYFNLVNQAVAEFGWKVEPSVDLGLFSFQKLVIYKDLEANAPFVTQHPIIRAIAGIKDDNLILQELPDEKDVDKIEPPEKTYQVLDADSSQRVSIEYALRGQSFVMKGPPGTGKSQTIANIIAECIANGKSVLFVSDKMAALEVVYKRLSEVGLAHFCLELHSSKANKQHVVAELKRSLDENLVPRKLPSTHDFERMTEYREALNGYVAALHERRAYLQRSAYEVLSLISSLERVPFVPVGLTELETLTSQKMHELEGLVSELSKVWEVIEEPDFPWLGYRADSYSLELRSEVLTTLGNINETLINLQTETEAFSAKLGVFPPETFARVNWLLELSKFLNESPKPEAHWLTDPHIDKLYAEAKNYHETSIWLKNNRSRLMERYEFSLFNLAINRSTEIKQQLEALKVLLLPGVVLEEGEFLGKCEKLLAFVKNTQIAARKWRETSQTLAPLLGLDADGLTIKQVKELSRMALLCFAEDKPEPQWFDGKYFEQVEETVVKAKRLYQDHSLLKSRLYETYTDGIYELDLDGLIARYNGYSQNPLKIFSSSYRNDQKQIARVTNDGKVPKTLLTDLVDARRVKKFQSQIEESTETVQILLGHFYQSSKTDFLGAEKALALTAEIRKLSWATTIPENLLKLITNRSNPSPMIKNLGLELQESVEKWTLQIKDLESLLPANIPKSGAVITQTPLQLLEEWANETEKHLSPLCELTRETLSTCKQEPTSYEQLLEDLRNAEDIRKKEAAIADEKVQLQKKFGSRFDMLDTNWEDILVVLEWVKKVQAAFFDTPVPEAFAEIAAQGSNAAPSSMELTQEYESSLKVLNDFESRFEAPIEYQNQPLKDLEIKVIDERILMLRTRVDHLQVWIDFKDIKNRFTLRGLDGFFNRLAEQRVPSVALVDVFRRGVYQEWINNLYNEDPKLGRFRRENQEQLIADFKKLDQDLIRLTSSMVIEQANSRKPQDILIQAADSEAAILQKEAAKKRQLMPIRILFQKIPNLLVKLKPCLLMSPISVSQFLPPDSKFDLVLFDEASQIVPEDAIGSIYRGKTLVVAGDNKQLPPTSFFQKNLIDDVDWDELNDEDAEVFDSILDECLGIGLPVKTLRWHYRSKHEELIAFSNHRFYDDALVTFPAAKAKNDTLGVKLVYVQDGVYDRGGKRDNLNEAEKVADLVFEHFRLYPKKTLGVVTFSIAQMETVEESIDRRLKERPDFESFFKEDRLEGFFVKNLENVQGDERDAIFFSIGYGFDQQRQMTMNFGPLNKPGGERRLNVAVTRAREKVVLVTSIKSADIDPETKALGVQTLRNYLEYAEHGPETLDLIKTEEGEFESALDEDVAAEIKKLGYHVVPEIGCSGYKIDIGVIDPVNPSNYLLGIECDGASYKSSNSARDRDRLREQVLRQLGWRIHRVWSPAWVARRTSEIRRLKEALEQASKQQLERDTQTPIIENKEEMAPKTDVRKIAFAGIEKIGLSYKTYPLKASFSLYIKVATANSTVDSKQKNEFHFPENRENQTKLLDELVQNEGPVHFDYAVERLAAAWGIKQVTPQINHAVKEALSNLLKEQRVVLRGSFLWPPTLKETSIRVPVQGIPESRRKAEYIAPEEIESAMQLIARYALGISEDSLVLETAKVFGLNHSVETTKKVFSEILQRLVRDRKLASKDGVVTPA